MKTTSIARRVADFLKGYPPFSYIAEDDLLLLAGSGRVRFHEDGEYLFRAGKRRDSFIHVIQQGTVHIVEGDDDLLVDMRGPGDLVGISVFLGESSYQHSALTKTETMVYLLPWQDLRDLMVTYPAVARYFAAYFSVRPRYYSEGTETQSSFHRPMVEEDAEAWVTQSLAIRQRAVDRLITCLPGTSVAEAARRMRGDSQEALVVVNKDGHPLGMVTETDFCARVATGEIATDSPVELLMTSPVKAIPPNQTVGDMLLQMMHHKLRHLCVTNDGTPSGKVVGLIAERDVQVLHGRLPTFLVKEIRGAERVEDLTFLRQRAAELMLLYLSEHQPIDWVARFISEIDELILQRVVQIAETAMIATGFAPPTATFAWLGTGYEGRGERLLPVDQETILVFADAGNAGADERWFSELTARATAMLGMIGYRRRRGSLCCEMEIGRGTMEAWSQRLQKWFLSDSETVEIGWLKALIDNRLVVGSQFLAGCFDDEVRAASASSPRLLERLTVDCLRKIPPLTIFQNSVVDQTGMLQTSVDTENHLLHPLADCVRVLSLHSGCIVAKGTRQRLRELSEYDAASAELYDEASEAYRMAMVHQTLAGLRHNDDGQFFRPSELSKVDQELLKSMFRSVIRLCQHTSQVLKCKVDC